MLQTRGNPGQFPRPLPSTAAGISMTESVEFFFEVSQPGTLYGVDIRRSRYPRPGQEHGQRSDASQKRNLF